jgi:putative effector of murein hydrolase LrgA (UPF0299 family)
VTSFTLKIELAGLPCWPAMAIMFVPSGFAVISFTSLTGPRCSQRE